MKTKKKHKVPWRCRTKIFTVQFHTWDCEGQGKCNGDHRCKYCKHDPNAPTETLRLHPRERHSCSS